MLFFEIFLRSGVATISLLGAFLLFKHAQKLPSVNWIVLFLVSLAFGATIHTAEGIAPPASVRAVILPVSASFIVLLWIATRAYFDDEFRFGFLELAVIVAWLGLGAFDYLALVAFLPTPDSLAGTLRQVLSYALVIHTGYVVLKGTASDLVEGRRRSRLGFTLSLLSLYLLNRIGENIYGYAALPLWFTSLMFGLLFVLITRALLAFVEIESIVIRTVPEPLGKILKSPLPADPQPLIARLDHLMASEKIYLEPDLSIQSLARRMKLAEHHLRVLINQAMGFRNFRTYLNSYRVEHATRLLLSTDDRDMSILEIAMNSGFGSLASFNRVFKSVTKSSPREMRLVERNGRSDN